MQTRTTDGYVVSGEATMIDIYIYNIGVLTVKIEIMWRGLETGKARLSIRFAPSHIHSIFTVNTPILYLSCNRICQKKSYLI